MGVRPRLSGEDLGDALDDGDGGGRAPGLNRADLDRTGEDLGIPASPPRDGDDHGLTRVLEHYPMLAPALDRLSSLALVRGMAHALGMGGASRADHVHVIGNGVDPVVAADAIRQLAQRLAGGQP